ncbi:uncharacterized protein LOC123299342 [Chrysoperla carnea]|uniref:uncharacterized protein LOC123299342 n=1 Tax=Chrysoperla carnea TaxID=189513 RepID=UPI001D07B454|nr:uncharacterized protein LOC123299342 [Chrysoperla carnea]
MSERGFAHGSVRKRGHQHHPRYDGTRRRNPTPFKTSINSTGYNLQENVSTCDDVLTDRKQVTTNQSVNNNNNTEDQSRIIDLTTVEEDVITEKLDNVKSHKNNKNLKIRSHSPRKPSPPPSTKTAEEDVMCQDISLMTRSAGEGSSQSDTDEEDPEIEELASLRCPSERTEVIAERETRRRRRCADYPGLAFGRSIFSSDTMMKFSIIRNELHNIMNTQLKRVRSLFSFECIFFPICLCRPHTDMWCMVSI